MSFTAGAAVDRGITLDLGIEALAAIDVAVGKFLGAELSGQASAAASVRAQIQAPMNLFSEAGFAVRLQAAAELAAAVQVGIGLKVGDFLALAADDPRLRGLPVELLGIFLSEVTIKAQVYAKAALTAQAYAQLVVTGTVIPQPALNLKPGFNIIAGAGAGLKAGAGFRVFALMELDDVSRLVARSVDRLVDGAVTASADLLPPDAAEARVLLEAARPLFKTTFRAAYELGEHLALEKPPATGPGAEKVALRLTQVVLEEGQRFLLGAMAQSALDAFGNALALWRASSPAARWDGTAAARRALADHLARFPPEPFPADGATDAYWADLFTRVIAVAQGLRGPPDPATARLVSVLWSASVLARVAFRRAARADAHLDIVGLPPRQAHAAFSGALPQRPPGLVEDHIRGSLGRAPGAPLDLSDLVAFVLGDAALDLLLATHPGAARFLDALAGPLGPDGRAVARTILRNIGSVVADAAGRPDPAASLAGLAARLRALFETGIRDTLAPVLRGPLTARPDLAVYFDEVFLPSTAFTLDTVFAVALDWGRRGGEREEVTEALSGVVMKLFGRTLVATCDVMLAATQAQISDALADLADHVDDPGGITSVLARVPGVGASADEIAELAADGLRIGAEVLGPLSDIQRQRIRTLMYEVIDPLPVPADSRVLATLRDRAFLPNAEAMTELAGELAAFGGERFLLFVQKLVALLARKMLEELDELFATAQRQLSTWMDAAGRTLADLQRTITAIGAEIERFAAETAARFDAALDRVLDALSPLAGRRGRERFKDELAARVARDAIALLAQNDIYRAVAPPGLRASLRALTRQAVSAALDLAVVDQVLGTVGSLAREADSLVDDVRDLDPSRDLATQVANLVLNRLTDQVYDMFGRDPQIRVGFDVEIFGQTHRLTLGFIDVPVAEIVGALRAAVRGLDAFERAVEASAAALASAFDAERSLRAAEARSAQAEGRRADLAARHAARRRAPRAVRILSPTPASALSGSVVVRVEILGPPPEAYADDDAPAPVQVALNGRLLPLASFTVAAVGAADAAAPGDARARFDPRKDGKLAPALRTPKPGAVRTVSAGLRRSDLMASAVRVPDRAAAVVRPAAATGIRAPARSVADLLRTGAVVPPTAPRQLGRLPTLSEIGRVAGSGGEGVVLTLTLPARDLQEGLNTLAVSAMPPSGPRIEAACAFFAAGPAPGGVRPKPGEVRLPGIVAPADLVPRKVPYRGLRAPAAERKRLLATEREALAMRGAVLEAALAGLAVKPAPATPVADDPAG